jgi:hypothetical protein
MPQLQASKMTIGSLALSILERDHNWLMSALESCLLGPPKLLPLPLGCLAWVAWLHLRLLTFVRRLLNQLSFLLRLMFFHGSCDFCYPLEMLGEVFLGSDLDLEDVGLEGKDSESINLPRVKMFFEEDHSVGWHGDRISEGLLTFDFGTSGDSLCAEQGVGHWTHLLEDFCLFYNQTFIVSESMCEAMGLYCLL